MSIRKRMRIVKRPYSSPLREENARATLSTIIDAAAIEFAGRGYVPVSIDDIARRAGVSRATVFNAAGGKAALLRRAFERAFARAAGGGAAMPLIARPRSVEIRSGATSQREYLTGYARLYTEIAAGLAPIYVVMRAAAQADPEVAAQLSETNGVRRRGCTTIVHDVVARGPLRAELRDPEQGADIVYVLNDPGVFHTLVIERGWTKEAFAAWLVRSLITQLV